MKKSLSTFIMVAAAGLLAPVAFVGCQTSSNDRDAQHKRTAGQYIDDKVLIQRVQSGLGHSEVYKFPDVKVQTYRGTVQLTGFVENQEQKRKAEEIARGVNGVYNVQNDIMLKGDTDRVRGTADRNATPSDHSTTTTDRSTTYPSTTTTNRTITTEPSTTPSSTTPTP